jgi:glycosyltransferase involved in cell wall biosynthesis
MTVYRPDVTIVISCFNQAAFIGEAARSALGQTAPCEVVVVDDGSSDGSADVAEELGARVVRFPHRGALETFRAGIALVDTPFYCLLNADDALDRTFVESTRPPLDDPRVGFVYTGVAHTGAETGTFGARPFDAKALRWGNYVHGASLTRTAAYRAVGGFDPAFRDHLEDWALWVAIVCQGWIGVPVDRPLLRYHQHAEDSRNRTTRADVERARLRIALRHPRFYGAVGIVRLAGSAARLAITGE